MIRHPDLGYWPGRPVCVAGIGRSGTAAAEALVRLGADVTVVDARAGATEQARAEALRLLGVSVRLGPASAETLPAGTSLIVTSPGWRPDSPLLVAAAAAGVPVWGEVELAWSLRPRAAAPWLAVTGTNGKTTTVQMLAAMLRAAGHRTIAAGNVGTPLVAAVLADRPYDVLAVELSSFQLHWSSSLRPAAAAILNLAPDHLDWHGSLAAYAAAKAKIWAGGVAIGNADDPATTELLAGATGRRVTFTAGVPGEGQLGRADGVLVDRAFGAGVELAPVADVRPPGPHNVANALAAAALARAFGVAPAAVRGGLRDYTPGPHRNATVARVGGVTYVDDSKATNPHAAGASLAAYASVVWIAGGLLKGADVDHLVRAHAARLRGVVLLGRDRAAIAHALARHAPEVPVVDVGVPETGAMDAVMAAAGRLARPGDTVLLAPAAASMDMFRDYAERGDAFAAAVRRVAARAESPA